MTQSIRAQIMADPAKRRRAVAFILVTLVIDAMGIGLILPVMPQLIEEVRGVGLANAALWGGVLAASFSFMQFLFGPAVGSLSDRYGRRPVLLFALAVLCLDYMVMATANTIWLLLIARMVAGVAAATQSTCTAYIADISRPEDKSANFGLVGAAFGIGFILGPIVGGLLAEFGTRAPFYAAGALAAINLCYGYFVVPETVDDDIRRPFEARRANPLRAFAKIAELPGVTPLLVLFFLYEFAFIVYPAIWAYFTTARFGWEEGMIGLSLALFGIGVAIVQAGLLRLLLRHIGERLTILYGFVFNFSAFVFLVWVDKGLYALLFTPISALGAVVTPALQGRMSRVADDNQQGELQGVISSARSIAQIMSPIVMTQLFFIGASDGGMNLPGLPFALSAVLMVLCLALFLWSTRRGT